MSSFEELLNSYEPPSEVEIFLPAKLGEMDKGGSAAPDTASDQTRTADQSSAAAGPEPEPQLPEGSDPDEPEEAEETEVDDPGPAVEQLPAEPVDESGANVAATGTAASALVPPVIPRKGGGLSFEGESAYLKQFPRVLIDQMREILERQLGSAFARDISQVSIVTAFAMASIGADIATDEITAHAVRAFRASDPRADLIDERTAAIQEQAVETQALLRRVLKKVEDVEETAAVLEMGQAYSMAERTAQLDTMGVLPETIDVAQKRVVAAKNNIRVKVAAHRRDERTRAGRPIR